MASALRCRTRCLAKCVTSSSTTRVPPSATAYRTPHNVGCWIASSSGYHTAITWQRNKKVDSGSSFRLFVDYSTAIQMPPLLCRQSHRHNSTASGIFRKIFILNAESTVPNEDVDPAAVHSQPDTAAIDTGSQGDPLHLDLDTAPDAAVLHLDLDTAPDAAVVHSDFDGVASVPLPDVAAIASVPDATSIPLVQSAAAIPPVQSAAAIPPGPEDAAIPSVPDAAAISSVPDVDVGHSLSDEGATYFPDVTTEAVSATQTSIESIAYIPPPPAPPEIVGPVLNALGEPTFESIGLAGWTPPGIIQGCLEYLHVTVDLPWWCAICVATVVLRTLIFPLVIKSQKNAAKMNNCLPQLQILQMKMTEARNSGDQLNAARYGQEMVLFMKEKDISPLKNVIVPLAQAPIFISMFIGLRGLANLPVESFKDGGIFWFTDLTVCDPYYLLPIITSFTMYATIELGTDGARLSSQNMQTMKWVLRAMPLVIFPFTINFPAAVLCYWVSTNLFSLVQVGFLRIPSIRDYFKIDALITHKPETLPEKKKGVVDSFKDSWKNMQISKEIADRERYDEMRFKKSGAGPIVRTYKHDPTKRVINIQAKMKSK